MIRQIVLALVLALIGWNAAEELWARHHSCSTGAECGCVDCLDD